MSISLLPDRKEGDRLYRFLDCVCVCVCVCLCMWRESESESEREIEIGEIERREREREAFSKHMSHAAEREEEREKVSVYVGSLPSLLIIYLMTKKLFVVVCEMQGSYGFVFFDW